MDKLQKKKTALVLKRSKFNQEGSQVSLVDYTKIEVGKSGMQNADGIFEVKRSINESPNVTRNNSVGAY